MKTFEDLDAWKKSRELVKQIYGITNQGNFARDFGLKDQIRRAAVSIISNIAEGFERDGTKEFIRFLSISKASAGEVRSQLYVALDQEYINQKIFDELYHRILEISRMLSGLITSLKKKI